MWLENTYQMALEASSLQLSCVYTAIGGVLPAGLGTQALAYLWLEYYDLHKNEWFSCIIQIARCVVYQSVVVTDPKLSSVIM
jgi:hypothetical protein